MGRKEISKILLKPKFFETGWLFGLGTGHGTSLASSKLNVCPIFVIGMLSAFSFNSLGLGRFISNVKSVIFMPIL